MFDFTSWNGIKGIFHDVQTNSSYVVEEVIVPIEATQTEIKYLLVGRANSIPQILHVIVIEFPFIHGKVRNYTTEFVNFRVCFRQPVIDRKNEYLLKSR